MSLVFCTGLIVKQLFQMLYEILGLIKLAACTIEMKRL